MDETLRTLERDAKDPESKRKLIRERLRSLPSVLVMIDEFLYRMPIRDLAHYREEREQLRDEYWVTWQDIYQVNPEWSAAQTKREEMRELIDNLSYDIDELYPKVEYEAF